MQYFGRFGSAISPFGLLKQPLAREGNQMPEIILHHYEISPFAELARVAMLIGGPL
jgi:hypothetical protein